VTITREQVADLRPGDVVEMTNERWPEGTAVRGPLWLDHETLQVGAEVVRHWDGRHPYDIGKSLTVLSRAPRPLYVNHPRTEPVAGDVVRDADSGHNGVWFCSTPGTGRPWIGSDDGDYRRDALPDRLRLLVDGETGQVVR
jgi:hypothetical protein